MLRPIIAIRIALDTRQISVVNKHEVSGFNIGSVQASADLSPTERKTFWERPERLRWFKRRQKTGAGELAASDTGRVLTLQLLQDTLATRDVSRSASLPL